MLLLEGADLRITAEPTQAKDLLVVTFTGRDHNPPAPGGAGQGFLTKNGIAAVHFISKANHWWQTPEFAPALDMVRQFADAEGFAEVVTYGSSMGGYGALVASGRLKAARMVVSVPQYSIDPAKVPWERRWLKDAKRLDFSGEDFGSQIGDGQALIFSDPYYEPDQNHVDRIRAHRPVRHMKVAFAEHDVSRVLAECELLSEATLAALYGRLDEATLDRRLRTSRRTSPLLFGGASRLAHGRGKTVMGDRLGAKAFEMLIESPPARRRPEHARLVQGRIEALLELNQAATALATLDRWAVLTRGEDWATLRLRATVLAALGDGAGALDAILAALRARPVERETLRQLPDLIKRFADPGRTGEIYAEFRSSFLKTDAIALRMIGALKSKGLGGEAADLAKRGGRKWPDKAAAFNVKGRGG